MNPLFTIGYEGADIDRFVAALKSAGVRLLVDVRAVTVSRKRGFSKKGLQARLECEGIRYLHLADLGDPAPGRLAARAGRINEFRKIYLRHLAGDAAKAALDTLAEVVDEDVSCLMCFERDPKVCHRSIVAEAIHEASSVVDLYVDEPDRYRRHENKLPRLGLGESAPPAE